MFSLGKGIFPLKFIPFLFFHRRWAPEKFMAIALGNFRNIFENERGGAPWQGTVNSLTEWFGMLCCIESKIYLL